MKKNDLELYERKIKNMNKEELFEELSKVKDLYNEKSIIPLMGHVLL